MKIHFDRTRDAPTLEPPFKLRYHHSSKTYVHPLGEDWERERERERERDRQTDRQKTERWAGVGERYKSERLGSCVACMCIKL